MHCCIMNSTKLELEETKKAPFQILTAIFKFKAGSRLPIKQPNELKFAQSFGLLIAIYCASCDKTRKSALRGTYTPGWCSFLSINIFLRS